MLRAVATELSTTPIAALGGVASIASVVLAFVLSRKRSLPPSPSATSSSDGRAESDERFGASNRPIVAVLLIPSIVFGFALIIRIIFQIQWFAGLIALFVLGVAASAVSAWLAAVLLDDWLERSIITKVVAPTRKGRDATTTQYVGDVSVGEFADRISVLLAGCVVVICLGMIVGPWLSGVSGLFDAANEVA